MVRNEFAGTLYHTTTDMLDAIAEEWVSGCGVWDEDTQRDILDESTDAELAGDAINDWDLARSENGPTHMELNGTRLPTLPPPLAGSGRASRRRAKRRPHKLEETRPCP
jgi:hypothetical protein